MPPDQPPGPLESLHEQLRSALDTHLASLSQQYDEALAAARTQLAAEADQTVTSRVEAVRSEWAAKLDSETEEVRREAERRLASETLKLRMEAEQRAAESEQSVTRLREEVAQAQAAVDEAHRHADEERQRLGAEMVGLRTQVETHGSERAHWESDREAERGRAQAELQSERQHSAGELESLRRRLEVVQEERRKAEAEIESERRRVASEHEEAQREAARRLEALKDQHTTQLATQLAEARRQAADDIEKARSEAREAAAREESLRAAETARLVERQSQLAGFDRLASAMRAIDSAQTLSETLDTLLEHGAASASRAALFIVNGDRLRSWKAIGFPQLDAQPFESAITGAGLLAQAVQTGEVASSAPAAPAPTFAAVPADRAGLAMPIMVGGCAVAVLYADNVGSGDVEVPASWPEAIETLVRHASTVLALLTAARTMQALGSAFGSNASVDDDGARRYARLLISEIKLYNESAVRTGRERRDLLDRLGPQIDRARHLYEERVSSLAGARGQYFQQELVQTLADGDPALLGKP
jgi:hypothetical protein